MLLPIPFGVFVLAHLSIAQEPSEGGDLSPPDLPTPQAHEDTRCRCVCPNLSVLLVNITQKVVLPQRQIYVQSGVVPSECRCDQVVSPKVLEDPMIASHVKLHQINEKFCPRCVCKSETRNTTVIKIVVIFISFVIGVLSLYMGFLFCLDPWMKRNKQLYHMQTNEEINLDSFHLQGPSRRRDSDDTSTRPRGPGQEQVMLAVRSNPGSVLHRVGHQQSKWQRTVQEQRRNIYDRRAILN
ncbi:proton-transporting V-type ATPase complex assembly regulator TMEM9-like isoform X1 [Tigriopus californicus]|uniref:proton-transporting V-type ATPase complex assembly regulator TMEM9-like isoform X1 n=1 Tax=Tigriopus californicus TaxID=6832 RepID=UPI0027DA38E1|nr:proton-transporting V-type ATPase complex assembly regulator TMEM9-like isoform X1 [Tigriopus californicus]